MSDQDEPKEPASPGPLTYEPATPESQVERTEPTAPDWAAPVAAAPGATATAPGWPAPPPGPARERPSRRTLLIMVAVLSAIVLILLLSTAFALGRRSAGRFDRGPMMGRMHGGGLALPGWPSQGRDGSSQGRYSGPTG